MFKNKRTLIVSLLALFFVASAAADQASCNADAQERLDSCIKSTKDSNVKKACLATFYAEVAKCAYEQSEENKKARTE